MNGGIFMIVAKISCSPSQKETKKLPVMWVPAAENEPFQKMFSASEGDILNMIWRVRSISLGLKINAILSMKT